MARRAQLIAHRGDPRHAPENTQSSIEAAARRGAKTVEVDVRRTGDGVWVIFHDPDLKRLGHVAKRVNRTSWSELQQFKVQGKRIPSLSEILQLCRRKKLNVLLDVKIQSHEQELRNLLRRSQWLSHITVGAGTVRSLRRWKRLLPQGRLFWVTGTRQALTPLRVRQARRLRLTGILAYRRWVTRASTARVHDHGLQLYVWTARTVGEIRRLVSAQVDGIMSEVWPPPSI